MEMGHEVVSVDISNKYKPDICVDVLKWDYKVFPEGHFDVVWASPPCEKLSVAPLHRRRAGEEDGGGVPNSPQDAGYYRLAQA